MPDSAKKTVFRLIMISWGILLGFAVAEFFCKWLDLKDSREYKRVSGSISRQSAIPGVRYELIPGSSGITPGQNKIIRVNTHGFRGAEISSLKSEGIYRIAVLGDSISFGRTLEEGDVFPYQIPRLLATKTPQLNIEIINASLSGRDTWEQVALLEHKVLNLEPDMVIIQVCLNDHIRFPAPDPNEKRGAFGERPWYSYSSLLALLDRRWPQFRSFRVPIAQRLGFDMRSPAQVLENYALDMTHIHDVDTNWDAWHPQFVKALDLCQERDIRLVIVTFPTSRLINVGAESTIPKLTRLATRLDIPLLDMLDVYRDHGSGILYDYTHPTREGHSLAAAAITDFIAPIIRDYP